MADLNCFSFSGRLTKDAEVKETKNGKAYIEMNVANNVGYGDYAKTNWLRVVYWKDKTKANEISSMFTKGSAIVGCGDMVVDEWFTNNGDKKFTINVTVYSINIVSKKKEEQKEQEEIVY